MPKHVIRIPPLKAGRSVSWTFEVSAAGDAERGARAKKARKKRGARQPAVKGTSMARVRREPDVVTEWAANSEASAAMPTEPTARAAEPTPAIEAAPVMEAASATEVTPAIEVPPAVKVSESPKKVAAVSPVGVPLAAAVAAPRQPAPVQRTRRLRPIAYFAASVGLVATLAFPRRPPAPGTEEAAGSLPTPSKPTAELVAPSSRLLPLPAATAAALDAQSAASRTGSTSPKKTLTAKPDKNHAPESTTSSARLAAAKPIATISLRDATAKLPGAEPVAPLAPASIVEQHRWKRAGDDHWLPRSERRSR